MKGTIDRWLDDVGMDRWGLRIRFRWRGKRKYLPAFSFWWWVFVIGISALSVASFYIFVVGMIILGPR